MNKQPSRNSPKTLFSSAFSFIISLPDSSINKILSFAQTLYKLSLFRFCNTLFCRFLLWVIKYVVPIANVDKPIILANITTSAFLII